MKDNEALYFECESGISGDMAVAALLDVGADQTVLQKALDSIPAHGFTTRISRVNKGGVSCCDFDVILDAEHENHDHDMEYLFGHEHHHDDDEHGHHHEEHEHHHHDEHGHHHHEHRGLAEINDVIDGTDMTDGARSLAKKIFSILAQAESAAHNVPLEKVHFHEVGALDSIVDVIALSVCFDNLSPEKVYVPYLCEGRGTVRCQHGIIPVPVPAVSHIVSSHNLTLELMPDKGEFVTPTGAAFVAAVCTDKNLPKRFSIKKMGMGAGKREYKRPSILRAFIIEENDAEKIDEGKIFKLETNVDDSTGEQLGFVMERLFDAGAFDVHYLPCFMKKNRPGYMLDVICSKDKVADMEKIIFEQTTTIGIRRMEYERSVLPRSIRTVVTEWGNADVKDVVLPGGKKRAYPEYESVAKISREKNLSYAEVYEAVKRIAEE